MTEIPLIDLTAFLDGTDKPGVGEQVGKACRDIGFLVVEGQGVEPGLIADMHEVSKAYFDLPFWERMRFKMPSDRHRGYTPYGTESLS